MVSKCEHCKVKKVSITNSFPCKCGIKQLCNNCRLPEMHNCQFDFKTEWRKTLEKNNPLVKADKLEKIDE